MLLKSKIRTIIVEDELESQEYIQQILTKNFSRIEIVACAQSIKEATALINKEKPELVFMDIELVDGYSFEIFDQIKIYDFEVIFITAFDNFIKKAIEHYAFSYIVKPVAPQKLVDTVKRYVDLKERVYAENRFQLLSNFLSTKDTRFLLHTGTEHISVKVSDIIKCEAHGNYTWFYFENGKKLLGSKSLKYYEGLLINKGFFKAHRSILININYIESIYKKETIILRTKEKIQVSVRNKSNLIELINVLS